jgi:hypothetical protein
MIPLPSRKKMSGPPPRKSINVVVPKEKAEAAKLELHEQDLLFEVDEDWKKEWKGMPEFIQVEQAPFMSIKIHFENYENAKAFGELIGQNVTQETKWLWWPKVDLKRVANKRYEDMVTCPECNTRHKEGVLCPNDGCVYSVPF